MTITYWPPMTYNTIHRCNEILPHEVYRAIGYKLPDVVTAYYTFQDAVPCWDASMTIQRRLIDWENMGKLKPPRNPLECL